MKRLHVNELHLSFTYEWEPYTLHGKHLTFEQHCTARLSKTNCSHWGSAIYKWEGILAKGPHIGKVGILIGETGNLRQRIKLYVSGTQVHGNKYWREHFLTQGKIHLYILRINKLNFGDEPLKTGDWGIEDFSSGSRRVAFEQLLVMNEMALNRSGVWLVNRKL